MSPITPLPPSRLRVKLNPATLEAAARPVKGRALPPQPRALQALDLSTSIKSREHNVYVSGEPGMGRRFLVESHLRERLAGLPVPPDWIYVHNFEDPERPCLIPLPTGEGRRFKNSMSELVSTLQARIPALFRTKAYLRHRDKLVRQLRDARELLLCELQSLVRTRGFEVEVTDKGSLSLSPLMEGRPMSQEAFDDLSPAQRRSLSARTEDIVGPAEEYSRRLGEEETAFFNQSRMLDRKMASGLVRSTVGRVRKAFPGQERLLTYLDSVESDILDNLAHFKAGNESPPGNARDAGTADEDILPRYQVNLFVDNSSLEAPPVITEDNPSFFNLLGCIQRETEMGSQSTDFTLLKAGSLHRASGGVLVVRASELLSNPSAWEGLVRALSSGTCRIEDPVDAQEHVRIKTVDPEPLPLEVRLVMIGDEELYETLLFQDERFAKFFKLKAHLQEWMERTPETVPDYIAMLRDIVARDELLSFTDDALGLLVDLSSRLADDQEKLTLYINEIRDVMIEADAMAKAARDPSVDSARLEQAIAFREYRANLYEEEFLHEYDREVIQVPTQGSAVGRVNGLSIRYLGDYVLALPHQISCTVGVGHGGVLDLEREAELGGPIHTKGMMILKSYLNQLFAQDKPLVFTGSLCFEQSYAHVDGDSAAGAELAALLSALSRVPVSLSLAFTGAVSQTGRVLAVGEVTRKVEGFFEVCRRRGLSGDQGVIIPRDNVINLMLKNEVVAAVESGRFHIYPVETIEQAMELLTARPAGRALKNGGFTKGSLYQEVDIRLKQLASRVPVERHGR